MTNVERADELEARTIAERVLGFLLVHADAHGDVDYRFTRSDGTRGALEVTTVTDPKIKVARDHWDRFAPEFGSSPSLDQCWQVWISERDARFRGLLDRLEPALVALEKAGRRFDRGRLHEFIGSPEPEQLAAQTLVREKVTQAFPYPEMCRAQAHEAPHRIDVVRESGWSASGSDATLALIEADLNSKPDNYGKVRGADEKHLFTWVDRDTDLAVARPFRGGTPTKWEHFGLPSRAPNLLQPVDALWIVDRPTGTGWIWSARTGWASLSASAEDSD